MRILEVFRFFEREILLTRLANHLARECRQDAYHLAAPRARPMAKAEARGYIRATAAPLVRRHAATRLANESAIVVARQAELTVRATEIIVQLVLREMAETGVHAPPARKVA